MDKNPSIIVDIEGFSEKETYTAEEKIMIMDRLNELRLIQQKADESLTGGKRSYTEEEKKKILDRLNEDRISEQKREEIKKKRTNNKEVYKFATKEFYKLIGMKREYYIEIEDSKIISRRPRIITLHYRTIDLLQKKDVLIKSEIYSEKFFISHDPIRVYYKGYSLEDKRQK